MNRAPAPREFGKKPEMPAGRDLPPHLPLGYSRLADPQEVRQGCIATEFVNQLVNGSNHLHAPKRMTKHHSVQDAKMAIASAL